MEVYLLLVLVPGVLELTGSSLKAECRLKVGSSFPKIHQKLEVVQVLAEEFLIWMQVLLVELLPECEHLVLCQKVLFGSLVWSDIPEAWSIHSRSELGESGLRRE